MEYRLWDGSSKLCVDGVLGIHDLAADLFGQGAGIEPLDNGHVHGNSKYWNVCWLQCFRLFRRYHRSQESTNPVLLGTTVTLPIYVFSPSTTALLWLGPVYAFFISFAGLFGAYFAELYPTRVRTIGAGFCFNVGRGVSALAPFLLGQVAATYSLATGIGLCAGFFFLAAITMMFLPDTQKIAGKSLVGIGVK